MRKSVSVGKIKIGGGAPISVQSMTNTDTRDKEATLSQIKDLAQAGCDIVRVSVYDQDCAKAVRYLVDHSPVPLVADIHFDHSLAIAAIENGISKLRINPGNLADEQKVKMVVDCAKRHGIPIRIGVNSGSLPTEIRKRDQGVSAQGLVDGAKKHVELLEKNGFEDIVLSLKSSDVRLTVEAYRLANQTFPYPLHVGVTEAGLSGKGTIKSAIGIGALLLDGIGDTIRVSLSGSPLPEPAAALGILNALNLRPGIELISCPTCGRTEIDVEGLARTIEEKTKGLKRHLKVAVMGCVVNGPGEAQGADIALCGGKSGSALFVKGIFVKKIEGDPTDALLSEIHSFMESEEKS